MSILTKVCVVILVLMVLIAVPVFITQATVPASWKTAYGKQAGRIKVLEMQAAHIQLALRQANALADKRLAELTDLRTANTTEVNDLKADLRSAKLAYVSLDKDLKDIRLDLMRLQATLKGEVERRFLLAGQLDKARTENKELSIETRQLEDESQESEAKSQRLDKVIKVYIEQLAGAQEEIKELQEMIAGGGTGKTKRVIVATARIEGTITTILGDLAGINIGSAKGMKSNMVLIVYRGSEFVARLRVQEVEIDEAAGTIFDKRLNPIKGDKVTTRLR